jgi:hypothetical protein
MYKGQSIAVIIPCLNEEQGVEKILRGMPDFVDEVVALTGDIFSTAPDVEEIDLWAAVPIDVRKDEVVSGDLARPTSRTVFSVTVLRSEGAQALHERAMGESEGVFWDAQWTRDAFRSVT